MGTNNYSYDMERVIFRTQDIEIVKSLPNVFIHPEVKPDESGIYTIVGTKENYSKFHKAVIDSWAAKKAINELGMPDYNDRNAWDKVNNRVDELKKQFVPWYKESEV